jgi:hypothetical protein
MSNEEEESARANSIPIFRGDKKKYLSWRRSIRIIADAKDCCDALDADIAGTLPTSGKVEIPEAEKAKIKARKQNKDAMALLTLSLKGAQCENIIQKCCTKDWPNGIAWRVMSTLEERFNPSGIDKSVSLTNELAAVTMGEKEDPAEMIDKLEAIKVTFDLLDEEVPEKTLVARALVVAPEQYGAALVAEKRQKGDKLTLEDVRSCMADVYAITYGPAVKHKADKDSEEREVTLSNVGSGTGKRFSGTCFYCNKRGHKASECRSNPNATEASSNADAASNQSDSECDYCGKKGHTENKCWIKPGNEVPDFAVRRLQQMASNNSKGVQGASVSKDDGGKEILCGHIEKQDAPIEFDKSIDLLKDPNVWIGDSGSSTHSTGHSIGIIKMDTSKPGGGVVTSSGLELKPQGKGQLPITVCDKTGRELVNMTMSSVKYVPGQCFNLMSISRMQKNGWKLDGGKDFLRVSKDGNEIKFDIMIPTEDGCVYAGYLKRRTVIQGGKDTKTTAKELGRELSRGGLSVCGACTAAKARQKNVPQDSEASTVKLNKKADANENKKDEKGTPEFEEAAVPTLKDGEGDKTKAEKVGQLFTDDDAHKNTQSGGATGSALKHQEQGVDTLNSSSESELMNENEGQAVPSDEDTDEEVEAVTTTRSGRAVRPPKGYRETSTASFEDAIHEEFDSTWKMKHKTSKQENESTDWQLVAPKKKRKTVSGHGSSRGYTHGPKKTRQTGRGHSNGSSHRSSCTSSRGSDRGSSHDFDRGSARGEGVGDGLGATGTLARGARRTTPIQKSKVKFSTETK